MQEKFELEGKVAIVTGASRGLGRGYARALAGAGALVVCTARSREGLEETVSLIKEEGGKADYICADFSRVEQIKKAVEEIAGRHGRIDILVNNAGTEKVNPLDEVREEDYDKIMDVNLKAVYFAAQAVYPHMQNQGGGKIINIGSLGSEIGLAGSTVYCASKGGVLQLTRALAVELAEDNIQVNAIGPGYFRTSMTEPFFQDPDHREWIEDRIPLGRIGTPEDLAGCVVFLAAEASDYVTGQIFYVDGGWLAS